MVVGTRVGTCNGLGGSTTRLEAVKGRTVGKVGNRGSRKEIHTYLERWYSVYLREVNNDVVGSRFDKSGCEVLLMEVTSRFLWCLWVGERGRKIAKLTGGGQVLE